VALNSIVRSISISINSYTNLSQYNLTFAVLIVDLSELKINLKKTVFYIRQVPERDIATDSCEISYAFLILTVLYYGISSGHRKYEFQMLSYTWDIALRNLRYVNKARAMFTLTQFKNRYHTRKYNVSRGNMAYFEVNKNLTRLTLFLFHFWKYQLSKNCKLNK
jgi:hypothetical protein